MVDSDLKELEGFLHLDIPYIPERIKTFFDIGGFTSKEVIVSRFYAYYFDPYERHGFGTLFLSALLSVLNNEIARQKKPLFTFSIDSFLSFKVDREVYTGKGYIDILIECSSIEGGEVSKTLIIENKLFYNGENPWDDYLNYSKSKNNTFGIILSLDHDNRSESHQHFINIKHRQLVREVEYRLKNYLSTTDYQHLVILKEFIQNMKNMDNISFTAESYSFLVENKEKIMKLIEFNNKMDDIIFSQIKVVCERMNDLYSTSFSYKKKYHEKYKFFKMQDNFLYFTIGFYEFNVFFATIHLDKVEANTINSVEKNDYNEKEIKLGIDRKIPADKPWHLYAKYEFPLPKDKYENSYEYILSQIEDSGIVSIYKEIKGIIHSPSLS